MEQSQQQERGNDATAWFDKLNDAINVNELHTQYINLYTRYGIHELVTAEKKEQHSSQATCSVDKHGRGCHLVKSSQDCVYTLSQGNSVFENKIHEIGIEEGEGNDKNTNSSNVTSLLESFRTKKE